MYHKHLQIILSILLLACLVFGAPLPNWSEMIVNESAMQGKGNSFTQKAYQFMQNKAYKNFNTLTAVAGKTAILQGGILIVRNTTYMTPEFIPTNVDEISKYDILKIYTLFNVVYYIEKIDQDIDAILNDIHTPPLLQTVQASILLCVYNKDIIQRDNFSLYVYDNEELAKNFGFYKGQPVGSTILETIESGNTLPETPPNVMIISGKSENLDEVIQYCRENNILTVTDRPQLLKNGVTIGVGTYSDDVKLILNTQGVSGAVEFWVSDNIFYKKL